MYITIQGYIKTFAYCFINWNTYRDLIEIATKITLVIKKYSNSYSLFLIKAISPFLPR